MNKLEEIVDQNGERETFTYDSQGRMASHTDRNHVKTTYGYNMDDQLRFKRAEMLEDTSIQAGRNKRRIAGQENKYSYKSLGQLIEASGKVAGITDKSGKKTAYQYDKAGRILSVSDNGQLVAEYGYYEDGKLRQVKFANGVETNYTYNADKNYQSITTKTAEGEILLDYSYAYDGNGNRTKKVGSNVVSEHAGNRALKKYGTAENFKTGNYLEERYQYDNRNRLLERKNPKDVTYYQYDKQGNTVSELTKRFLKLETVKTQNGSITTVSSSLEKTELGQYDQVIHQYYLRARYYNPLVGRFTQEDVYRGDGLNLYAYCGNNPVMYVDPSEYSEQCGTGSESGKKTIKSTLGNEIDVTPSSKHTSVNKNPGPYGEANTSVDILDAEGNIKTRRWYDSDGKAYRDVDMSDHGNPKEHPEVPHEHTWEYNNGKPKRN